MIRLHYTVTRTTVVEGVADLHLERTRVKTSTVIKKFPFLTVVSKNGVTLLLIQNNGQCAVGRHGRTASAPRRHNWLL